MTASALGRRSLLKGAALLGASAPQLAAAAPPARNAAAKGGDALAAGAGVAEVEIADGRIAGYARRGIQTFKGVPYGASTAGRNRFLPPRKPEPWTGVRSCRHFGLIAPQDKGTGRLNDEEAFMFQWNDSVEGEDCLRLNVWTPGLTGRRPVMVWLHGGGFEAGSGHDLPAFDGENLARRGEVVVVTLNHRLNVLGFLDLSAYGEPYAASGNLGMLDIVAALEWVRDNIAAFGGDPGRVLVFGQSGGGAKVSTLMGMPAAKGLFHRAVVQSGSFAFANPPDRSRRLAELLLAELGVAGRDLAALQATPYADLRRAGEAALRKANGPAPRGPDVRRLATMSGFWPVVDGRVLPASPFNPQAPAMSAEVPIIIGTTLNEFTTALDHPEYEAMSEAELLRRADAMYPGRAAAVVAAFRRSTPDAKPFDLWSRIATAPVRQSAIRQADAKAAQEAAPAYLYLFSWRTPVLDGRPRAFHCAEIPFVFANTERCDQMTGGGPRAQRLSEAMADAWVRFAQTGDPNHPGLPRWTPYAPQTGATMIFDDRPRLAMAPDREELRALS